MEILRVNKDVHVTKKIVIPAGTTFNYFTRRKYRGKLSSYGVIYKGYTRIIKCDDADVIENKSKLDRVRMIVDKLTEKIKSGEKQEYSFNDDFSQIILDDIGHDTVSEELIADLSLVMSELNLQLEIAEIHVNICPKFDEDKVRIKDWVYSISK